MEQDKNGQVTQQTKTEVEKTTTTEQGRQPQTEQQTSVEQSSDISQIDQQEGQMDNGRLGGNFDLPEGQTDQS